MKISLIIPVYNEQNSIPIFYKKVKEFNGLKEFVVEFVFVNDGSLDNTEDIIDKLAQQDSLVKSIHFVRNFGKESALMAGLSFASGNVVIPIDVDLQDPIELIPEMIYEWQKGADVVLAKRVDRKTDNFLKRKSAVLFYKIHNKISYLKIEENVGDFRLLSKWVVERILLLEEKNLFMKGIYSWVGGNTVTLEYKRPERSTGDSKFNAWKLWNFALDGITSFSTLPLRIWTYIGILIAGISFIYGLSMIIQTIIWGNPVKGYPSLLVSILFLGGVQLIGIGILGEYLGRVYIEVKNRPRYMLKEKKKRHNMKLENYK
ncbi:glycosyltransferase family 2 protein [Acinetobacter schindleri]|uniref:Glycosyltransferase family 2 protein n=1 Tax=Acinetobacter schindleri TaxID=108981 RepID=A0AAE6WUG3_9GAMM|nr:glycosyltransferase family 2 protein [Acinetobacter schindleri]QIC66182.1 glycosyltransferase family 2 protein [Acinetobacter schindleri]